MLTAIYDEEKITKPQLSDVIGQGETSVDNNINKLKRLGLLAREGSNKIGRWVIHQLPPPRSEKGKVGGKNNWKFFFIFIR